jgi:chromosome segregation ATPase
MSFQATLNKMGEYEMKPSDGGLKQTPEYHAWQAAKEKLHDVERRVAELQAEESELAERVRAMTMETNIESRAEAFLIDGESLGNRRELLAEHLEKLREQIDVVSNAMGIQRQAVDNAGSHYSLIACEAKYRPAYVEAAKAVLAGIEQLTKAFRLERAVIDEMDRAGIVRHGMPTIRVQLLNNFLNADWVDRYISELKKNYPEI